jgi:hypothetical protein
MRIIRVLNQSGMSVKGIIINQVNEFICTLPLEKAERKLHKHIHHKNNTNSDELIELAFSAFRELHERSGLERKRIDEKLIELKDTVPVFRIPVHPCEIRSLSDLQMLHPSLTSLAKTLFA